MILSRHLILDFGHPSAHPVDYGRHHITRRALAILAGERGLLSGTVGTVRKRPDREPGRAGEQTNGRPKVATLPGSGSCPPGPCRSRPKRHRPSCHNSLSSAWYTVCVLDGSRLDSWYHSLGEVLALKASLFNSLNKLTLSHRRPRTGSTSPSEGGGNSGDAIQPDRQCVCLEYGFCGIRIPMIFPQTKLFEDHRNIDIGFDIHDSIPDRRGNERSFSVEYP